MGKNDFFAFTSRLRYINRWALMRNTRYETLSEHSAQVSALTYALSVIGNRRLQKNYNCERASLLGLYHDVPEIITGDLPTPVKYFSKETKSAYREVEKNATKKLLSMLPDDLLPDYEPLLQEKKEDKELWKLVKAADKLSAYIKCIDERKAGNTEFSAAEESIKNALQKMECVEVKIFMDEFLPSYEKTLDKLQK